MGDVLDTRLGVRRKLHPGEEALLALAVAAGDLGAAVEDVLRSRDLTRTQYGILRMLLGAGAAGLRHAEIGERLLVGSPDVTRLTRRLGERGWLSRERDRGDRRVVVHRLTGAGREKLESLEEPLEEVYHAIVRELGGERVAEVVLICERVIQEAGEIRAGVAAGRGGGRSV